MIQKHWMTKLLRHEKFRRGNTTRRYHCLRINHMYLQSVKREQEIESQAIRKKINMTKEPYLLKQCRPGKRKRTNKRGNDQGYDLPKSDLGADEGSMRKRCRGNSSGKKIKKADVYMEDSYDGAVPSEDELTMEDLVSIAEEYVSTDMKEPQYLQLNSKTRSEKDPTAQKKDMKPHTHNPLSTKSVLMDPLCSGESSIYPVSTGDPAQDMLDLLLGGFLKKSKEAERKNDAITKYIILNHDVSRRSRYDTVGEVVPVVRKKASLKDKVAMLLD
ncbi:uncharacterized protein LOC141610811 [Silene latifolia]|uniref:uncharacterized protein LOC141610811 n=1 Tax=Silene latifolia TaxID=37657 RepID=UPI003D7840D0